jgi:hypothetical protein
VHEKTYDDFDDINAEGHSLRGDIRREEHNLIEEARRANGQETNDVGARSPREVLKPRSLNVHILVERQFRLPNGLKRVEGGFLRILCSSMRQLNRVHGSDGGRTNDIRKKTVLVKVLERANLERSLGPAATEN